MRILKRFLNFLRDRRHSGDIADELAFHIDMRTEENIAAGMPPEEARLDASRRFGNRTLVAERTRDFDIPRWLDHLMQDLRYAARALRTSRGTAVVLLISLALGIGANTAMFTVVDALLMRPLPVRDPSSLYSITLGNFCSWGRVEADDVMNYALWKDLQNEQTVYSGLFAYAPATFDISSTGGGEVKRISGAFASSRMWSILGLQPVVGRFTLPSDEKPGSASAVAVLGEIFWESRYSRDPSIIGRNILVNGKPLAVIGVVPRRFFGMFVGDRVDVYLPLEAQPLVGDPENALTDGKHWWLTAFGRLRTGVSLEAARRHLTAISAGAMRRTMPPDWFENAADLYLQQSFETNSAATGLSSMRRNLRRPLTTAFGLLGLLLLLACVNIATVHLSRGLSRQREFAVRIALGASRARVGFQVFLESLIAALGGAALGIALSYPATAALSRLYSTARRTVELDLNPDARVLAFTAALAFVTALLFGIAPALQAMRTQPYGTLKSVRATGSLLPVREWLIAVQVGLAIVLAAGALLFSGTLHMLTSQAPGLSTRNVLLVQMNSQRTGIEAASRGPLYRDVLRRVSDTPGVERVGMSYVSPLSGSAWQMPIAVEDDAGAKRELNSYVHVVTPEFFAAYETPVIAGRSFSAHDDAGSPRVALANRTFVNTALGGRPAIGRRLRCDFMKFEAEIVGIVTDAKYRNLRSPAPPTIYVPMFQQAELMPSITLAVRTSGPMSGVIPALRRAFEQVNPKITYTITPFESQAADSVANERAMAALSGLFGTLALLLAAVGIYGVAAYSVAQRRAEIGLRMAIGASVGRILRLLFTRTGRMLIAGLLAGIVCAAWAAKFTESLLFQVAPRSPWVYAGAASALLLVAAIAVAGPAIRAARVDPSETLRAE